VGIKAFFAVIIMLQRYWKILAYLPHRGFFMGNMGFIVLFLVACQSAPKVNLSTSKLSPSRNKSQLILNNATLEQSNIQGQTLWRIQVKSAVYTPDNQKANLTQVRGNLFQEGQLVLQVSADNGEVFRNGEDITLKNNVIAIDPRNQASLRSNAVEWHPRQSLLKISQPLKGSHRQLTVVAQQGQYNPKIQQLDLFGKIEAISPDRYLQLKTEHLFWNLPQHTIKADQPLQITRFQDKVITDQLDAQRAEVNLEQKIAMASGQIAFKSLKPPLQAVAEALEWDYQNRKIQSDKPVKLIQYGNGLTITANRSQVDLNSRIANLSEGVQGINERKPSKLYAQNLIWNLDSQTVDAQGNVIYQQSQPKFNVTGEKANGVLKSNNIIVHGNPHDRVVTEIFPKTP
jgi:LPS export ABC transporter protein LptC